MFKLALIAAVAGLGLLGMAAGRLPDRLRTPVLGVIAGTGYGVLGIAARVLNGFAPLTLIRDPATYALIAAGIVSFLFYASALEGGSVTVATAAVVLAETLPPAAVGRRVPRRPHPARPRRRGHRRLRAGRVLRGRAGPVRRGGRERRGPPAAAASRPRSWPGGPARSDIGTSARSAPVLAR